MTTPQLDRHDERAVRELLSRLRHIPPVYLADPYAFAVEYVCWLHTDHWRRIEPQPDQLRPHAVGEDARQAAARGAALCRDQLRKDTHA